MKPKISWRNSKEHAEFWTFLRKYQALSMRRDVQMKTSFDQKVSQTFSDKFNLPKIYDKSYRFNFVIPDIEPASRVKYDAFGRVRFWDSSSSFPANLSPFSIPGNEVKQKVPEERIKEFKFIVQLYLDFMQKEKVTLAPANVHRFVQFNGSCSVWRWRNCKNCARTSSTCLSTRAMMKSSRRSKRTR